MVTHLADCLKRRGGRPIDHAGQAAMHREADNDVLVGEAADDIRRAA